MDYVARAKALLMGKGRTGALLVLPLAAAVQLAQAATVGGSPVYTLPDGGLNCQIDGASPGGACSGGATQLGPTDGLEGVSFYLPSPITLSSLDGSSGGALILSTSGAVTATHSGSGLPAETTFTNHYDFAITPSGSGFEGWTLTYELYDQSTDQDLFYDNSVSGASGGTFSGSFTDTLAYALNTTDTYELSAEIRFSDDDSEDTVTVTIPSGGSFDLGTDQQAPSPEPSTLSFGALSLAVGGIWRGLRRKRTADPQ
jgi:hypothetical protein